MIDVIQQLCGCCAQENTAE